MNNEIELNSTEQSILNPFIKANNLKYPIFLELNLSGIKINSGKTNLKLSKQESFFLYVYLTGKFKNKKRFKICSETSVLIIE